MRKQTFGGYGYVFGIDCGDGVMGACLSPNLPCCIYSICTACHIACQFYFNKVTDRVIKKPTHNSCSINIKQI